jgi:hypothetical protein
MEYKIMYRQIVEGIFTVEADSEEQAAEIVEGCSMVRVSVQCTDSRVTDWDAWEADRDTEPV